VSMKRLLEIAQALKDNVRGNVITFDFDHTIVKSFRNKTVDGEEQYQFGGVNKEIIKRIKKFKSAGSTVMVVTSREVSLEDEQSSVKYILDKMGIEVDAVFYTNGEPKAQKLYELGSRLHYDDDPAEHEAIHAFKKLHDDFKIEVKYPDDLIKDTNDISKGVIITSDYKFIVAERSDSFEWDAPGGHIMEGEEAPYAFWREVKEELGLEVEEVQYLDTQEISWKGKEKLAHYFFGRIDYSSEQLEGLIVLQWEVSNYFCGDYEELLQHIGGNATQNLENVVQMIEMQQELLESYQNTSSRIKNHPINKRVIVGLGGNKETGAKGLKKTTDFSRAKSAAPGYPGGLGTSLEENLEEPEKKIKIRIKLDLDEKKKRKKKRKGKKPGPKKGSKQKKSTKSRKKDGIGGYYPYWDMFDGGSGGDSGGDGGGGGE